MKKKIYSILNELGVSFNLLGRQYIVSAVLLIYKNGRVPVTREVYPQVATEFNTTSSRVERAIRHAIEKIFSNGNIDAIGKFFGINIDFHKGKLTNTDFLYGIVEYLIINN